MNIIPACKSLVRWCYFLSLILLVTLPLSATGTFTISALPSSLSVPQSGKGTSTITTTISGGFNSSIALSSSGAPMGVGVTFTPPTIGAPGSGNSTMTINVLRIAPIGTYPITVAGNGGGVKQTTVVNLTVTGPGSFTLSANPSSISIAQGQQGTSTITATLSGGFNGAISLSSSGAPSNTSVTFSPNPIPAPGSGNSTMTINVGANTPTGVYPITVTGTGSGIQQTVTVTLTVTPAPTFTISASPMTITVPQGTQGSSTITTTALNGFNNPINLSVSGTPPYAGITMNPWTIPAPGSGNSAMTVNIANNTPIGSYPVVVTGNGGGVQQSVTVTVIVTGPPSFTISASPLSLTIAQGNQGTSAITTAIYSGFNSPITLSSSGQPSTVGITFSVNPIPAPGAGNSVMTVTVGSNTPPGNYSIVVTGNGGGVQQSVTLTLTVTQPNFTISASPNNLTIQQGNQGSLTITTTISGGFNSSISLSASGMPTDTNVTFTPPRFQPPERGIRS